MSDAYVIPLIFGLYLTVSGLYQLTGREALFTPVDYTNWVSAAFTIVTVPTAMLFHMSYALFTQTVKWRFEWDNTDWYPWLVEEVEGDDAKKEEESEQNNG